MVEEKKILQVEKVTREMLRDIKKGSFEIFMLPNGSKVLSASTSARQVGIMENCSFAVNKVDIWNDMQVKNCIKITRVS